MLSVLMLKHLGCDACGDVGVRSGLYQYNERNHQLPSWSKTLPLRWCHQNGLASLLDLIWLIMFNRDFTCTIITAPVQSELILSTANLFKTTMTKECVSAFRWDVSTCRIHRLRSCSVTWAGSGVVHVKTRLPVSTQPFSQWGAIESLWRSSLHPQRLHQSSPNWLLGYK